MLIVFITSLITVNAKSNIYYTNKQGVEMTEEQYIKLKERYDDRIIENFNQKQFDFRVNSTSYYQDTIYIVETIGYDRYGNVISTEEKEYTEEEYEKLSLEPICETRGSVHYETASKRVNMQVSEGNDWVAVDVFGLWINNTIPKVKSYDVIGWHFKTTGSLKLNVEEVSGHQAYNNDGLIVYDFNGNNSVNKSNGYGISMNIVDETSTYLGLSIEGIYNMTGSGTLTFYGTYQHAKKNVTLAQSKSYTFSTSGLGQVFNYSNTTIRDSYDGMKGVSFTRNVS